MLQIRISARGLRAIDLPGSIACPAGRMFAAYSESAARPGRDFVLCGRHRRPPSVGGKQRWKSRRE
jgi:hypothetical protein